MDRRRTYALAIAASALVVGMGAARPTPPGPSPSPSPSPSQSPSQSPTATQSDGTLQILTYRGYAEYGGTSPKVNWTGAFEKETGCRIAKLDTVQTAEEMADKVDDRPYDVISAGPVLASDLIAKKQVQAIDPAKVAGYDDIDERFRDMSTVSGKVYGVPYLWGYHEFIYDASRVEGRNLREVFASERVALRDAPLTIADAAMADGSDEPYELTTKQLDETMALLEGGKDRVYWRNPIDLVKGFATGSLDYAQATPYYKMLLQKAGKPIKAVSTRETTGWVDSWMLGANVPDTTCAYRWLNWVTAADAQRDAAAWVGLAPANDKACKGRARQMCEAYGAGEDKKLDHVLFAVRPPACGECSDYDAWTERWRELAE